jgi:hypothetical protein
VGGLVSPVSEHVNWVRQDLAVGDTVTVKIVETGSTDVPQTRKRSNPAEDLKNKNTMFVQWRKNSAARFSQKQSARPDR